MQLILMALETHSRWNQPRRERGNVELSILPKDATAIALAGDRTRDPSIKSPMRYQLRYGGSTITITCCKIHHMGANPPTC